MSESGTLVELVELEEGVDVEVKRAGGKDGRGEVPRAFFETYSAMANTYGGTIYLGIEQRQEAFYATGIRDVARVRKDLWDRLNNPEQVSCNLLREEDVSVLTFGEHKALRVVVPRAPRQQRPVYTGKNPFGGTFRRNFEGDYRCDEAAVRRMFAEQLEDSRDQRVIPGFGLDDLDPTTLKIYRQRFTVMHLDHPWNELSDQEFLRNLGGFQLDRASGKQQLTLAGLLMFGKWGSIADELPHYFLDYQEQNSADPDLRWTDRVVPDGTWSGNVFDFYRVVMPKLTADLKVPFRLQGGTQRIDESLVHEALREALVNALIHADYSGRTALRVIKRPDMFEFRNPGLMRVSLEEALEGGHSDCRNRVMQKLFQLVGLGDQAGSGIPKVYRGWRQQDWRQPELEEYALPSDHTVLRLRMLSLFPTDAVTELEAMFGDAYRGLSELGRLVLVTVAVEGSATHTRVKGMTPLHSRDVTLELRGLVRRGLLHTEGAGRGMSYHLPGARPKGQPSLLGSDAPASEPGTPALTGGTPALTGGTPALTDGESGTNDPSSGTKDPSFATHQQRAPAPGRRGLGLPEGSEKSADPSGDPARWARLQAVGGPARERRRMPPAEMAALIVALCTGQWLTLRELAMLLDRKDRLLRRQVATLLDQGTLELLYPRQLNHPLQAYRATVPETSDD